MKLRNKINRQKRIQPIIKWLKNYFKPTYTKVLYNQIIKELHSSNRIRIYMNSYYDVQYSFKHGLEAYHKKYNTTFNIKLLDQLFFVTVEYLRYKFNIYSDIKFITDEDDNGLYFEIKLVQ